MSELKSHTKPQILLEKAKISLSFVTPHISSRQHVIASATHTLTLEVIRCRHEKFTQSSNFYNA